MGSTDHAQGDRTGGCSGADPVGALAFFEGDLADLRPREGLLRLAEESVPLGELGPDEIHVSGVFVQRVIKGENYEKWIEQRTVRPHPEA